MKELITTQLIAEYQKEVDFYEKHIKAKTLSESTLALYGYKKSLLNEVIRSLQSKQSKERQNMEVMEKMAKAIDYTLKRYSGEITEGYEVSFMYPSNNISHQQLRESLLLFNQTFKQEQKVIDANGKEEGK